ncbi:fibrillin-1 [Exaiptasia diaphana]|uniref:Uncharacterized protein n=1 Tax=Exaiptasia diaphana TaxID=2652724 RepID=A0A913YDT0_EXADI|nr:fibrillin-1 [Exaiptasia diaphana]
MNRTLKSVFFLSDFDECSVANACHANAQCTNTFGSYDCKCKPGYHGDGKNCSDIDECSSVSDICDPNAQCTNNNGSYTCSCRLGFSGDGKNCSDIDECSSGVYPCHANAICTNTPGSHTCRCRSGFGDGRHTCRTLPKSCNERKKVFPASGSDTYTIDPGGNIGEVPYKVYCDMKDKGGVGVTVISHNRESWDYVNNCPCSPGSCSRIVSYNGASLAQLAKLTEISTRCEQYIHFLCNGDVAFIEASYAWWVSRDGVPQYYWGGATPGSKKCACGMTNTCQNNKGCNCHGGAGGWRADGGYLTDKTTLPVKEMRFGDTDDSNEDAGYYLGKLKSPPAIKSIYRRGQIVLFSYHCLISKHPLLNYNILTRMKLLPFILAVLCICAYQVANASKCKVTVGGIALVDHVMESFLMDNIDSCYKKCAETGGCESINFYNSNSTCELNSRTVENAPIKTVLNKDASHVMNPNPLDFDECSVADACHANAQCTNTFGSYVCQCKPGYHGDGKNCSDIDECSSVSDICDPNAQCTNNNGSYTCSCRLGFSGDGKNCSDIDECSSGVYPCHANANCTNTPGSHTCRCRSGFGDGRPTCRTTPKSCNEQKKVFPASSSGTYTIDPDGQYGKAHFNVHCNMTDKGGVGVTVVSHNSEARTRVNNCPSDPSCTRSVTYYWASFTQLAKLTQISAHCEQYIEYNCTGDVAFIGEQSAWWVSRDGVKQYYWGGATPGSKKCACGMTNTCHNGKGCNCHNSAGGWRRDRGLLTDKTTLPVKEMRFGDTDDSNEDAFYKLGKLKCY